MGQALAAACCRRSAFTSFRISFTSSRSSSIRLLTLASLALTSYQISPNRAVKKPDGNHSISPGGIVGMGSTAQGVAISLPCAGLGVVVGFGMFLFGAVQGG